MLINEIFDQSNNPGLKEAPGTSPTKRRLALANLRAGRDLKVGDDVVVTGPVKYQGATGVIEELGRQNMFAVVNLYNHGRVSFQASDLEINDYAGSDEEDEDLQIYRKQQSELDIDEEQGVAEATGDAKFDSMLGNIVKDTPMDFVLSDPLSGVLFKRGFKSKEQAKAYNQKKEGGFYSVYSYQWWRDTIEPGIPDSYRKKGVAEGFTDDLGDVYAMHPQPEKSEKVVFFISDTDEAEFSKRWTDLPDRYLNEFGYDLPLWDTEDLKMYPHMKVKSMTFDQYVRLVDNYIKSDRMGEGVAERKIKQRLDPKCWKGKKIGNPKTKIKGGVRVNNCVPK